MALVSPNIPRLHVGFLSHRATPRYHPFLFGIFHEINLINHPATLGYPHDYGNPLGIWMPNDAQTAPNTEPGRCHQLRHSGAVVRPDHAKQLLRDGAMDGHGWPWGLEDLPEMPGENWESQQNLDFLKAID